MMKIALIGNPNCGKTTLFNNLTGSNQYVGNWPGVTVEKKEGKLKGHKQITVTDLPGIYSLSPYTLEEVITRDYLLQEKPSIIINLVDATNIERNLYLTTQIMEMGIPVIIALNMMDIANKNGDKINTAKLAAELGCGIVEISALKGMGVQDLIKKTIAVANSKNEIKSQLAFSKQVEESIASIQAYAQNFNKIVDARWLAIKLFERDEKVIQELHLSQADKDALEKIIQACEEAIDDDSESIITNERYEYITKLVKNTVQKKNKGLMTTSDKIDRIVTNRFLALPIFAAIMWLVYYVSIQTVGDMTIVWVETFFEWVSGNAEAGLVAVGATNWLISLCIDGIIGGVGAVLVFVPQLMVLFFFLSILEDCGYMARVAFIMDRIFRKFGLSGKSFIPMLISSGCGVPGIMASRTIEHERDRKMTIMVTTFIPCGAKLPIIALIGGALFPEASWVAPSIYFLGITMVMISSIILKKTSAFAGKPAPFVMELPQYHIPGIKGVLMHMWEKSKAFIIKAGTIIFVACGIIWFLGSFNWTLQLVDTSESMLATIGNFIAPIFSPLGFGTWQAAVATITGFLAKENVVSTFGVLLGLGEVVEGDPSLLANMAAMFTAVSGYAFLAFNMLCAPCFAAIGAIKREMGGWKWTWLTIGYQTLLAYVVAFIIYQLGSVFVMDAQFGVGAIIAVIMIVAVLFLLFRKPYTTKDKKIASNDSAISKMSA